MMSEDLFPFSELFYIGTEIGELGEEICETVFKDIIARKIPNQKTNKIYEDYFKKFKMKPSNFDLLVNIENELKRIEVKVIRAAKSKKKRIRGNLWDIPESLRDRALTASERKEIGNLSFQQTKADMFDYLLGVVIYLDKMDFILVPSNDIKSGELKITNQHAGAIKEDGSTGEGHLSLPDVEEKYTICSVYSKEEVEQSQLTLSKYINDRNI